MTSMPSSLTKAEQAQWRRMVAQLMEYGIDPEQRLELLADYVRADLRIAGLRRQEKTLGVPMSRAVNVATAERRRLHKALFIGGKKPKSEPPAPPVPPEQLAHDEAWRGYFLWLRGKRASMDPVIRQREDAEREARSAAIVAVHGEAAMRFLVHDSIFRQ